MGRPCSCTATYVFKAYECHDRLRRSGGTPAALAGARAALAGVLRMGQGLGLTCATLPCRGPHAEATRMRGFCPPIIRMT